MLDLALSIEAMACMGGARDPLAAYPLALDFKNGAYWKAGNKAASLSAMPGYSYSRTGQVSYVNSGGTVTDFAANVPPILSAIGYEAYDALTNVTLQTQAFDNAAWTKDGTTATANSIAAPDGTTTADTITELATTAEHRVYQSIGSHPTVTKTVFAKAGTASFISVGDGSAASAYVVFDLTNGVVSSQVNGATGTITSCANGWYRCTLTAAAAQSFLVINMGDTAAHAVPQTAYLGAGRTVYLWQAQFLFTSFTDGGPIIATTTVSASIGAPTLSVSVPNGSYSAVYTFSDGTTQTIPTVISGGVFTMPTYPTTLNKPGDAKVTLS